MKTFVLAAALAVVAMPALAGDWRETAEPMTPAQMEAAQGKFFAVPPPVSNANYLASVFGAATPTVVNTPAGPIYSTFAPGDSTTTIFFVVGR